LRHCSAFGKTAREALKELEIAKALWIEAAKQEGKPVPTPKYTPIIYQLAG
jgi:predicted RNase H-like HicB family nuclease